MKQGMYNAMQGNNGIIGGLNQQSDSLQCSEVLTINQTNGFLGNSANQMSMNSDNNGNERQPDKRLKPNDPYSNASNNNCEDQTLRKENEKKAASGLLKEFDTMQFQYVNEEYSYQINKFCKRIASEKHAQEIACKFPLYKMIRAIVKKFLFNELELIFFGYVLEESKWKVEDIEVRKHAYFMVDFLNITEVKDLLDYKSVLLYLILTAYGVKFYLNDDLEMRVFNQYMGTIVKDFTPLFSYWSKSYGSTSFKIVPKQLNRVYRNLSRRPTEQNKKQHEDYNALVDAIIQISPPYNNEKGGNPAEEQNAKLPKQEMQKLNQSSSSTQAGNSTKTSSNFMQPHNMMLQKIVEQKQQQQQQQQQLQINSQSIQNSPKDHQRKQGIDNISSYSPNYPQNSFSNKQQANQPPQQQQSAQQQNQNARGVGELVDFSNDFLNGGGGGGIQGTNTLNDFAKRENSLLQGFGSNNNFGENMDFLSNNYNFNSSYPSLYPSSLLQNLANNTNPTNNNNNNNNIDSKLNSANNNNNNNTTGNQFNKNNQLNNANGNNLQNMNSNNPSNNFGLQSSGNFDNQPSLNNNNNSLGQSGIFNQQGIGFSNGFLGQSNNITNNNSYTSNQVGFNQLYNQFQASNAQNPSLPNLLFQTPKKN